jgi:CheY-like chemotaxis protein
LPNYASYHRTTTGQNRQVEFRFSIGLENPMKILVVEDHSALLDISCRLLRDVYGHDVRQADTGAKALQEASTEVPDLMLIDIDLPDMSGYDISRKLRADPGFDHTLLVAVTGYSCFADENFARAMGLDACFRKPLDFEALEHLTRA